MLNIYRLLIVDGEADLGEVLSEQLELTGEFSVSMVNSAVDAIGAVRNDQFDLIIIDARLLDAIGCDAVREIRQNDFHNPILMLTENPDGKNTIQGLEAGVKGYIVKPFYFAALLARIRAQLCQYEASEDAAWKIDRYTFHPSAKVLIDEKGSRFKLTEKEAAILCFLYRAGDQITDRETLLSKVWGYKANVTTHTLETHIYRLRQKIEEDPSSASLIITEVGGYRLAL